MGLFTRRRKQTVDADGLGVSLIALRLDQGAVAPPQSTVVMFNAGGHARRVATGRISGEPGEMAFCFHPGPYTVDLVPYAAAPEWGLRLRFVIDATNPRVTQQRFDLYLYSESPGRLELAGFGASVQMALQAELAQGALDLPPCTSLDEWHAFRAGLNQLMYTRYGVTVDDCVPIDLGEQADYAATLRARAHATASAPVALPIAGAVSRAEVRGTANAHAAARSDTPGVASVHAAAQAEAHSAARAKVHDGARAEARGGARAENDDAVSARAAAGGDTSRASRAPVPPLRIPPELHTLGTAPEAMPAAATVGAIPITAASPVPPGSAATATTTTATTTTATTTTTTTTTATTTTTTTTTDSTNATATATATAAIAAISPASPAVTTAAAAAPAAVAGVTSVAGAAAAPASPWPSAAAATVAAPFSAPLAAGGVPSTGQQDARALRRLFLELPALSTELRVLTLPAGLSIFQQHQALLLRLGMAGLNVNTMPALAWAAPDQPLAPEEQTRRAMQSLVAVAALDEAWSLLARLQLADHQHWPALMDEADRICANLETGLAFRRAPHAPRMEPSL